MKRHAVMPCLAALVLAGQQAQAQTIPFFNVQFDTTAIALAANAPVGLGTLSGPLGTEPVSVSASSVGATDVATAGAIVGVGLLTTSADVSGSDTSSAVATSSFLGAFAHSGPVSLDIGFTPLALTSGSGQAATTLFVSLTNAGTTLFEDYVPGRWQFAYIPAPGSTSLLSLTLASDVSAAVLSGVPGNASAFGQVLIAGSVPEVSTWLLLAFGLGAIAAGSRARRGPALA